MNFSPINEYKKIVDWTDSLVGTPILLYSFRNQLRKFLNSQQHPVKVKLKFDETLENSMWAVGGEYLPDLDLIGRKPIRIDFIINHDRNQPWELSKSESQELACLITETLAHEYQHLKQFRARNYKHRMHRYSGPVTLSQDSEQIEYLSSLDELDAYSTNIAIRLYIEQSVLKLVRTIPNWDLTTYHEVFGEDHPVTQDLNSRIEKKLKKIQKQERTSCS